MKNYQNVPIVMLTTESGDDVKALDKAGGTNGWMVRPFDPVHLTQVVRESID